MKKLIGALLVTLSATGAAHAQTPVAAAAASAPAARITAVRTPRAPHIDGRLDDAIWQNVAWITDFVQREPQEGRPASEPLRVAFAFDDDALYIAARLHSSDPAAMRALVTRRDREETSDQLLVSFDTYRDGRTAYTFAVTSAGVRIDYYHSGDFETRRDYTYDPVWQAETERDSAGWTAEIRIPFTQLRFNAADVHTWGVNVVRSTPARNEIVFWRLIGRNETGWASRMGELAGLEGIGGGRRVELLPYVATDARVNNTTTAGNPFSKESESSVRVGGDLKMGLGPSLTLDATFNPDFGQVEADPAEVNLSAYETFFAERRPFFLEGTQLLAARGNFYSRRIGARPLSSVPGATYVEPINNTTILGAAKVTGRYRSGFSVAALTALTAEERAQTYNAASGSYGEAVVAPLTGYGVVALQQEFGNPAQTSAVLYGILTGVQRDLEPGSYLSTLFAEQAHTGIVDYRVRWKGGQYDMSAFLAWSWLRGDTSALIAQQTSSRRYFQRPDAGYVELDRTRSSMAGTYIGINHSKLSGKHWLWDIDYYQEAPAFELNDVGRLGSADDRGVVADLVYRETQPGRLLRNYQLGLWAGAEWNFGGVRQWTQLQSFNNVQLQNYWQIFATVTHGLDAQSDNLTRGGPLAGTGSFWQLDLSTNNRPGSRTRLRAATTLNEDEQGGWYAAATAGIGFRPGTQWEISIDPRFRRSANARQYITTLDNGRAATYGRRYVFSTIDQSEISARIRVNYAITPDLTLETYAEPFAATAHFSAFGELPAARSPELRYYGTDGTTLSARDAQGKRTVTDGATSFTLSDPDFTDRSFRSNIVLRWEWRPGSTLFLVWQQNRFERGAYAGRATPGTVWDAFSRDGSNFFAVKLNYWLPLR